MPRSSRRTGKSTALTFLPVKSQSSSSSTGKYSTLAALSLPCLENPSYASLLHTNATPPVDLQRFLPSPTLPIPKYALGKGNEFPTQRRPQQRNLSPASDKVIHDWWKVSGIVIGPKADTPDRVKKAQRLVYTWKDCFAESVRDVHATDLLEHSIDLTKDAKHANSLPIRLVPMELRSHSHLLKLTS